MRNRVDPGCGGGNRTARGEAQRLRFRKRQLTFRGGAPKTRHQFNGSIDPKRGSEKSMRDVFVCYAVGPRSVASADRSPGRARSAVPLSSVDAKASGLAGTEVDEVFFAGANSLARNNRNVARMALLLRASRARFPPDAQRLWRRVSMRSVPRSARFDRPNRLASAGGVESRLLHPS